MKQWKGIIEDLYATSIKVGNKTFYLPPEGGILEKVKDEGYNLGDPVIATHDPKGNLVDIRRDTDANMEPPAASQGMESPKVTEPPVIPQGIDGTTPTTGAGLGTDEKVHIEPEKPPEKQRQPPPAPMHKPPKPTDRMITEMDKQELILIEFCIKEAAFWVNSGWVKRTESNEGDINARIKMIKETADKIYEYAKNKLKGESEEEAITQSK